MTKKIVGVTVGTPLSPKKVEEVIHPVKTVNGTAPDENGNVEIEVSGGSGVFIQQDEPKDAPDGSLWVVYPPESKPKGISLYYAGANEEELKNAPNGSVWLAPESSEKPATPEGGITKETDPTVPAWAKQPQKPTYTAAEVGAATPEDIANALANLPTGGDSPIEEIFRLTTTEEVKIIETGINLNEYAEIWAYCRTLPVEGSTTTRFDWWFVQSIGCGVANSLHNTQRRCHFARIENLGNNRLHVSYGYGFNTNSILKKPDNTASDANLTVFESSQRAHIVDNVNTNFKFGVYTYGNATLGIGTEILIFGRK